MNTLSTIVLDRHYKKLDMSFDQKEMLKNYLHSIQGYPYSFSPDETVDLQELAVKCNTSINQVQIWLNDLHSRFIFPFIAPYQLDMSSFNNRIQDYYYAYRSLEERMEESNSYSSDYHSLNRVKLEPMRKDKYSFSGIAVYSEESYQQMWSKEDMEELAHSILKFTKGIDQNIINTHNQNLEKKYEEHKEYTRLQEKKEYHERELKKNTPDPGYVFLIRLYPSGIYKFTHTTSLNINQKTEKIREEYNNQVEVIHTFETKFTSLFLHQFIRKQFRTRLTENGSGYSYELNDNDIVYIQEENFPPQAMEWLN